MASERGGLPRFAGSGLLSAQAGFFLQFEAASLGRPPAIACRR